MKSMFLLIVSWCVVVAIIPLVLADSIRMPPCVPVNSSLDFKELAAKTNIARTMASQQGWQLIEERASPDCKTLDGHVPVQYAYLLPRSESPHNVSYELHFVFLFDEEGLLKNEKELSYLVSDLRQAINAFEDNTVVRRFIETLSITKAKHSFGEFSIDSGDYSLAYRNNQLKTLSTTNSELIGAYLSTNYKNIAALPEVKEFQELVGIKILTLYENTLRFSDQVRCFNCVNTLVTDLNNQKVIDYQLDANLPWTSLPELKEGMQFLKQNVLVGEYEDCTTTKRNIFKSTTGNFQHPWSLAINIICGEKTYYASIVKDRNNIISIKGFITETEQKTPPEINHAPRSNVTLTIIGILSLIVVLTCLYLAAKKKRR